MVHAFDAALPGWLVVVPARHVTSLAELTAGEAASLGPLLASVSRALVEVTGCVKTYLALFAENPGFAHLHIHVVPRHADLPQELRGPDVFGYLGVPASEWVSEAEQDRIGRELSASLAETRE